MKSVTIVGASLAGLTSARALRQQGYDGRITLVGDEIHRPYDRPPLSKEFLTGSDGNLALETASDTGLAIDWRLGSAAVALAPVHRTVKLANGDEITSDAVVLATGAAAIIPAAWRNVAGVHVLRSLDDARALREELTPAVRVTIVGAGLIGSEVAAAAVGLGAQVTLVEASATPLQRVFGEYVGQLLAILHARGGAELITGAAVAGLATSRGRVTGVELRDGRTLASDVVVVGIGSTPNTSWLQGSGVEIAGGVITDQHGSTAIPGVVAVGDCAVVRHPTTGSLVRDEHWTAAATRPTVAIKTLLSGGSSTETYTGVPYVWSDQYQSRIQFAGCQDTDCVVEIVEGDPDAGPFVAVYRRADEPVAVLAVSSPRSFAKWRRRLTPANNAGHQRGSESVR